MSSCETAFETIPISETGNGDNPANKRGSRNRPRLLKPHQVANRLGVVRAMGARPRHA